MISFLRFIPFSYYLTLTLPRIQESASAKPGQIDFGLCANILSYSLFTYVHPLLYVLSSYIMYVTMLPPLCLGTHLHTVSMWVFWYGVMYLMESEWKISNLIPGLGNAIRNVVQRGRRTQTPWTRLHELNIK